MQNNETFLPRYNLDPSQVVFPAVNAKESTYRTVLMSNTGSTPILFDVEKEPTRYINIKVTSFFNALPDRLILTHPRNVIIENILKKGSFAREEQSSIFQYVFLFFLYRKS